MMKRVSAVAGVFLAAMVVAVAAQAAERAPYTPYTPRVPQSLAALLRLTRPAVAAACGAGERQCAIGRAITWCCRADQQCDYSYPGACR